MGRVVRLAVTATVAVGLAVVPACGRSSPPSPPAPQVSVAVEPTKGAPLGGEARLAGGATPTPKLVAVSGDPGRPLVWSDDGGVTWSHPATPDVAGGAGAVRIVATDRGTVVALGIHPDADAPSGTPFAWVSTDGGRTYAEPPGFSVTSVGAVAVAGDSIVVTGTDASALVTGAAPVLLLRWTEGGGRWTRDAADGLPGVPESLVAGPVTRGVQRLAATVAVPDPASGDELHRLFVSDDGGASWRSLRSPSADVGFRLDELAADGDTWLVYAHDPGFPSIVPPRQAWWSADGGRTWAGPARGPTPPDAPDPRLSLGNLRRVGGVWFGQGEDDRDLDVRQSHLVRSVDGTTWALAEPDRSCATGNDPLRLNAGVPVASRRVLVAVSACGRRDTVSTSANLGRTWKPLALPSSLPALRLDQPVVLPDGRVLVLGHHGSDTYAVHVSVRGR